MTFIRAFAYSALVVTVFLMTACSLTTVPPTSTPQPTPIPLLLPTTPPLSLGTDPAVRLNDSTCPFTPSNWIPYTVQPGDSLGAISVAVDTPLSDLVTNNCLENADAIFVQQVIYLPTTP